MYNDHTEDDPISFLMMIQSIGDWVVDLFLLPFYIISFNHKFFYLSTCVEELSYGSNYFVT